MAELAPRPDAPALVRKLPAPSPAQHRPDDARPLEVPREAAPRAIAGSPSSAASLTLRKGPPATVEPLAPARYRVQFTASSALRDKLEELQALMRSSVPDGDLAAVIEAAVSEKIERLKARRLAATPRPRTTLAGSDTRPGPRHIPAAVTRAVRERDGDRCAYVDPQGRRCSERRDLQFHHRHPHGYGGDRSEDNIALRCGGHNQYEAERDYGRRLGGGGTRSWAAAGCRVTGSKRRTAGRDSRAWSPDATGALGVAGPIVAPTRPTRLRVKGAPRGRQLWAWRQRRSCGRARRLTPAGLGLSAASSRPRPHRHSRD